MASYATDNNWAELRTVLSTTVNLLITWMNSPQNKLWKLYGWQNGTRWHCATLPGSMVSYGERTQTHTFENHANLLNYLANWPLYTSENVFQGTIKCQHGPFLQALLKPSLCLLFEKKNCQNALTTTWLHVLMIIQLCVQALWWSTYDQLSPPYLLSTLYATIYTRLSTTFHSASKLGRAYEWG